MALYLKYRPQNFADVVGQDHVVTTMEQAVLRDQLSHAYLLSGTRGTGKTSVARILAKTILLRGIEDPKVIQLVTKAVEEGSLVDLIEIDAASNRRIDDIRDLIEKVGFSPAICTSKVYIIDEVHMLTKEAFNALLKTLEEPPPYAYFILATTELHKVPDTIQSRCQRFLFKRVKDDDIIRRLQYIVDQEKIMIDRDALRAIARHASGSFRDGISLLDQLRSLEKITTKDITDRIGNTIGTFLDDILEAMSAGNAEKILATVERIEESNVPPDLIATDLLRYVREDMHRAIEEKKSINIYVRMMDELLEALKNMRMSPVPGLVLETVLLSFCKTESTPSRPSRILSREIPEPVVIQPVANKESIPEVKNSREPVAVKREKSALIEAEEVTLENVMKHWTDIVKAVNPPSARMSLKNGIITRIDGMVILLSFPSEFHRDKVADMKASRNIEDVLESVFKQPVRIKCVLEKDVKPVQSIPETDLAEAAKEVFGDMM